MVKSREEIERVIRFLHEVDDLRSKVYSLSVCVDCLKIVSIRWDESSGHRGRDFDNYDDHLGHMVIDYMAYEQDDLIPFLKALYWVLQDEDQK